MILTFHHFLLTSLLAGWSRSDLDVLNHCGLKYLEFDSVQATIHVDLEGLIWPTVALMCGSDEGKKAVNALLHFLADYQLRTN